MKEKLTDSELIAMVNGGNQQAFSELMKRYRKMVARVVIGMLGDTPEADDVGQEVFVRFYQSISSFRGDSALGTYLTRIAINLSLNELNSRKRRFLFFSVKDDEQPLPDLADEANVDESLSRNELIEKALAHLDPKFRSVILLRLIEGYSTKETAEMLGVPLGTVLSRLTRAQDRLKEIVSKLSREMVINTADTTAKVKVKTELK